MQAGRRRARRRDQASSAQERPFGPSKRATRLWIAGFCLLLFGFVDVCTYPLSGGWDWSTLWAAITLLPVLVLRRRRRTVLWELVRTGSVQTVHARTSILTRNTESWDAGGFGAAFGTRPFADLPRRNSEGQSWRQTGSLTPGQPGGNGLPAGGRAAGGLAAGGLAAGGLPAEGLIAGGMVAAGLASGVAPQEALPAGTAPQGVLPPGALPQAGLPAGAPLDVAWAEVSGPASVSAVGLPTDWAATNVPLAAAAGGPISAASPTPWAAAERGLESEPFPPAAWAAAAGPDGYAAPRTAPPAPRRSGPQVDWRSTIAELVRALDRALPAGCSMSVDGGSVVVWNSVATKRGGLEGLAMSPADAEEGRQRFCEAVLQILVLARDFVHRHGMTSWSPADLAAQPGVSLDERSAVAWYESDGRRLLVLDEVPVVRAGQSPPGAWRGSTGRT